MAIIRSRVQPLSDGVVSAPTFAQTPASGVAGDILQGAQAAVSSAARAETAQMAEAQRLAAIQARKARLGVLQDSQAKLQSWENDRLYGENGYMNEHSSNAVLKFQDVDKDYKKEVESIAQSIKDEETRLEFSRNAEMRRIAANRSASSHFARESERYQNESLNATVEAERVAAGSDPKNSGRHIESIVNQAVAIRRFADDHGWSGDQLKNAINKAQDQTNAIVFDQLIEDGDYDEAAERLSEFGEDMMGPELKTQIEKRIREGSSLQEAQDFADTLFAEYESGDNIDSRSELDAITKARKDLSGRQEEMAIDQLRIRFRDARRIEEDALAKEREELTGAILDAGTAGAAMQVVNAASPRNRLTLENLAKSRYRETPDGRVTAGFAQQDHAKNQIEASIIRDAIDIGVITSRTDVYTKAQMLPAKIQDELAKYFEAPKEGRIKPSLIAQADTIVTGKDKKAEDIADIYPIVVQRLTGKEPTIENIRPIVALLRAEGTMVEEDEPLDSAYTQSVTGSDAFLTARGQATFVPELTEDLLKDVGLTREGLTSMMTNAGIDTTQFADEDTAEKAAAVFIREQIAGFPGVGETFATDRFRRQLIVGAQLSAINQGKLMKEAQKLNDTRAQLGASVTSTEMDNYQSERADGTLYGAAGMRVDLDESAKSGVVPDWMTTSLEAYGMTEAFKTGMPAEPIAIENYIRSTGLMLIAQVTGDP